MAQSSISKQEHTGRDVQRTESDGSRNASTTRHGSQEGSSSGSASSVDNRNRQAVQSRYSSAERSATKSTAIRKGSTTKTEVTTPKTEGRQITKEDVGVGFSLEIDIELGNITDYISRT